MFLNFLKLLFLFFVLYY